MKLDEKDRRIISLYAADPTVSQDEIARDLGVSQPSVAARIKKLRDAAAIETQTGINPLGMGLFLAKVDIAANNTSAILDMFRNCPYFANGFTVSGEHNLCLFFVSENLATLEAIINGHIRSNPSVGDVAFNIVINAERPFIVPAVLTPKHQKTSPCGITLQCRDCASFNEKKCMGCPVTRQYQGWLY